MEKLADKKFRTLPKAQQRNILGGGEDTVQHCAELMITPDGRTVTEHQIAGDDGKRIAWYSTPGNTLEQTILR